MLTTFENIYAPTRENFIKANNSIQQCWANYFRCKHTCDEENAKYWLEVANKRVEFFCEKFQISEQTLFMYF